jgi:polyisoprenoid-binding protein YceI
MLKPMKRLSFWGLLMACLVGLSLQTQAQESFRMGKDPMLKITGGSSLKDWEMSTSTADGEGTFILDNGTLQDITALRVTMKGEDLKSGTRGMDNNAYSALNVSNHPTIVFDLKEVSGSGNSRQVRGSFNINGVTQEIEFPVAVRKAGNGFTFSGKIDTKLSEFSIDPPTALLGSVRTKDEISIHFETTFVPAN